MGKTTTVINLMAGLGKAGKKCLLVDADPQGNSTSGLGINKRDVRHSTYDLLTREERASEAILHTEYKNVDLIPSSMELAAAEIELVELQDRTMQLRQALVSVKDELTMYDRRLKLTEQVEEEVKTHFPDKVYKTIIPRNVRLSEAPSFGMPALYFDPHSRGSRAYQELTKEILKKYRNQK